MTRSKQGLSLTNENFLKKAKTGEIKILGALFLSDRPDRHMIVYVRPIFVKKGQFSALEK